MVIFPAVTSRPAPAPVPEDVCDTTRERVTRAVSEQGPITASELASRLGLTPAAVRRHLDGLAEAGLVTEHERAAAPRGRGRPARAYVLTDAGHGRLHDEYGGLAAEVMTYLTEQLGEEAVVAFARRRAAELAERVSGDLDGTEPGTAERAHRLAVALRREGFAASSRPVPGVGARAGVQLCQGHCPVRDVAARFPQLCEAEAGMFSELLGVHVQRLATQAQGDHVCTTFIPVGDTLPEETTPGETERDPL